MKCKESETAPEVGITLRFEPTRSLLGDRPRQLASPMQSALNSGSHIRSLALPNPEMQAIEGPTFQVQANDAMIGTSG